MFQKLKDLFGGKKSASGGIKAKILLVEDSEVDRQIVKNTLEKSGYQVVLAENGKVGLTKIDSDRPDLAILDCEMPEMGGVELCRRIKENDATKDIPVMFLTSLDTPKNIIDCFELDAENFLTKPISPKILLGRIKDILEDKNEGIKVIE